MSHETPHIADRADNDPREDPEALLIAAPVSYTHL